MKRSLIRTFGFDKSELESQRQQTKATYAEKSDVNNALSRSNCRRLSDNNCFSERNKSRELPAAMI